MATVLRTLLRIVSIGTDSHLFWSSYAQKIRARRALGRANITSTRMRFERPEKLVTSFHWASGSAVTPESSDQRNPGHLMADLLEAPTDAATIKRVAAAVKALTARFPVYAESKG
jgi:glycine hydroxymethyltransferase